MKRFALIAGMLCLLCMSRSGFAMSEEKMAKEVRKTTAIENIYKGLIRNKAAWGQITEATRHYENGMTEIIKSLKKSTTLLTATAYIIDNDHYKDMPPFVVIKRNNAIIEKATLEGDDIDIDEIMNTMLEGVTVSEEEARQTQVSSSSSATSSSTSSISSSSSSSTTTTTTPTAQQFNQSEDEFEPGSSQHEPGAFVPVPPPPSDCGCFVPSRAS